VQVHETDINHPSSADRLPGFRDPSLRDVAINQDMKMRVAVFLKFQDADVFGRDAVFPLPIHS
jgi:hypothetical protein